MTSFIMGGVDVAAMGGAFAVNNDSSHQGKTNSNNNHDNEGQIIHEIY